MPIEDFLGGVRLCIALGALEACGPVTPVEPSHPGPAEGHAAPLLGTGAAVAPWISPELPISASLDTSAPVAAAGRGLYFVVWRENSASPALYGARVRASDGALLDPTPIALPVGPSSAYDASVAFDGQNFLVVWTELGVHPAIAGARVRASDGAVLDTPPLRISKPLSGPFPSLPQLSPSVAFDGTHYLVVWQGSFYENGKVLQGIQGIRVRASDGQTVESTNLVLQTGGSNARVAYGGGRYLVVWNKEGIFGARVDAGSGSVLDSTPLALSTESNAVPAVASDGSHFLVVHSNGVGRLTGNRIRGGDGALLDGKGFSIGDASTSPPSAGFDGNAYWVSWAGPKGGSLKLLTARISPAGGNFPAGLSLSEVRAPPAAPIPVSTSAMSPGRFLVAYPQYDAVRKSTRAWVRLVRDTQSEVSCTQGLPTLLLNGAPEQVLECGPGPYQDAGVIAWDGCGYPLDVHTYNGGNGSQGQGPNPGAEGTYPIQYVVWDAMGHTLNALRTVRVKDTMAPVLRLQGEASVQHPCGSQWVDPGAEAVDACYGNLTPTVRTTGSVNGWVPGLYTVRYDVVDSGGNPAVSATRTVQVTRCPW
jgi:hypothetical protein